MNNQSFNLTAPGAVYRERRARLASGLKRSLVIFAGRARARNYATNLYPFRAGSHYLYFGGPPIKGAVWLIEPGSDGRQGSTLLRPTADVEDMVWIGNVPGDDAIASAAGVEETSLQFPDKLGALLAGRPAAYLAPPCPPTMEIAKSLELRPAEEDELQLIIDLRLTKDEYELTALRRAADIAVEAHLAAMQETAPGRSEAQIAGCVMGTFTAHHAIPSFSPIITVHGEVLHCETFFNVLEAGQLLLVDAGAEEPGGYAADITRTYPVNGRFTPMQRQLYDTVLRAERAAIAACVPGKRYRDIHDLAARVICAGLVEAELLRGDPEELAARRAHTLFYTHGVVHLLGLDVHDLEDLGDLAGYAPGRKRRPAFGDKFLRLDRDLTPGMVVTIEPGLYLVPAVWQHDELVGPLSDDVNRPAVDALLKDGFGGIRLEDDVHVLGPDAPGPEVFTARLPTDPDAVAAIAGPS